MNEAVKYKFNELSSFGGFDVPFICFPLFLQIFVHLCLMVKPYFSVNGNLTQPWKAFNFKIIIYMRALIIKYLTTHWNYMMTKCHRFCLYFVCMKYNERKLVCRKYNKRRIHCLWAAPVYWWLYTNMQIQQIQTQLQIQIKDKYKYKYKSKTNTNTNTQIQLLCVTMKGALSSGLTMAAACGQD